MRDTKAKVVNADSSCNTHLVETPKDCITSIRCFPKGSAPTLAASSTDPPRAAMAAATLVGAPPGFFRKCWPLDNDNPLSVQIRSINASTTQRIFFTGQIY